MGASRKAIQRMLDKLEGPIRDAFMEAVATITSRAQLNAFTAALARNDVEGAARVLGLRPGQWAPLVEAMRQAYIEGGTFTMSADVPARFAMSFDWTNPRAEDWLRRHSSLLIQGINAEQREGIRAMLEAGVNAGRNPRSIALDIVGRIDPRTRRRAGGIIGLNGPQAGAAINMRKALTGEPVGTYINASGEEVRAFWIDREGKLQSAYKRRDRRYDSVVRKAIESGTPLSDADINRLVGRYEDRLLELRGSTIGRTEALQALNASADESLRQVVAEGIVPPEAVRRVWVHSGKDNERPGHLALAGTPVALDEPWVNPETGNTLMRPGEGPASEVINCGCGVSHQIDYSMARRPGVPDTLAATGTPVL